MCAGPHDARLARGREQRAVLGPQLHATVTEPAGDGVDAHIDEHPLGGDQRADPERVVEAAAGDELAANSKRIQAAYDLLYCRPATDEELRLGLNYLLADGDPAGRWQQYAHVLLAANELLYVD